MNFSNLFHFFLQNFGKNFRIFFCKRMKCKNEAKRLGKKSFMKPFFTALFKILLKKILYQNKLVKIKRHIEKKVTTIW